MTDAIEAKLISWVPKTNGEVRLSFMVHRDDGQKVDALRWMVGWNFGLAFAQIDQSQIQEQTPSGGAAADSRPPQLSQKLFLKLCKEPKGRTFLEEFCASPDTAQGINEASFAKHVLKRRLQVKSLADVDTDPAASEKAEQLLNLFAGWERGLS